MQIERLCDAAEKDVDDAGLLQVETGLAAGRLGGSRQNAEILRGQAGHAERVGKVCWRDFRQDSPEERNDLPLDSR